MATFFSASNCAFYNDEIRAVYYDRYQAWPDDAVELTPDEVAEFCGVVPPEGMILAVSGDGRPAWGPAPQPTEGERIATAESKRAAMLAAADAIMLDWRTELALGEISDNDRRKLSLWLDYKKQVKAVDVSTAYSWPTPPAQ